ncbi:DUF5691 domain-containing protein [Rufibacter hautae]|uniref:Uncharacterized protein n=1 Tax=Rufibacter hautae TaxID=2595005 RepID=A0A5B6TDT8_9BACT|nr:DUF5691 domain-containing protein [Rufibacter hautae]KAA3437149.1 hypothetical protein FOA19_22560 [Rufibacter hautae]
MQDLLKSAMLGTNQYVPAALPPLAQEMAQAIAATAEDKEDAFLKLSFGYFLAEEAGKQLPELTLQHDAPPAETVEMLSPEANALLRQFILHKEELLLDYFLFRCQRAQRIVRPELLPEILSMAVEKKARREVLLQMSGNRGQWLAQMNPAWQILHTPEEENLWETGTWEQRKAFFRKLRADAPAEALALLQANLHEEGANARAELLALLLPNLSLADEPFLETQLSDKSQKVRQEVYKLLLQLPGSRVNQLVQAYLKEAVQLKEERVMLLAKKKVFAINADVTPPDELFAAGFEKTSSQKNVDDADYWVAQALEFVPPIFWQQTYGLTLPEVVQLWGNHAGKHLFLPALAQNALRFQNTELAHALLTGKEVRGIDLLTILSLPERFSYASKLAEGQSGFYLQTLLAEEYTIIPPEINQQLLRHFVKNPYTITQQVYHRWALQMNPDMLPVLQEYINQESEEYQMRFFRNVCTEMTRMLHTKEQINALL